MDASGRASRFQVERGETLSNKIIVKTEPSSSSPKRIDTDINPNRKRPTSSILENIPSKRRGHAGDTTLDQSDTNNYEAVMVCADPCCVCSDKRVWVNNPIFFCDSKGCKIAVHQGKCRKINH